MKVDKQIMSLVYGSIVESVMSYSHTVGKFRGDGRTVRTFVFGVYKI